MSKAILRGLMSASVVVFMLTFVVGCSRMGDGTTSRGSSDTTGYGTTQAGAQIDTSVSGAQGMQAGMSSVADATTLARLKSADSSEIAVTKYALDRLSDSRVKEYAQTLIDHHQTNLDQVTSLASKQNITLMAPSNDTTGQHMDNVMSVLKAVEPGPSFDQAFLQMQINDHQSTIDELKASQSLGLSASVKSHVDEVLPKLQKHLDQAQDLLKNLGMSQTGR